MTSSQGFFDVDEEVGRGTMLGGSWLDKMGMPFSLLDELNGCNDVVAESDACPFKGGCSVYFRNSLSPCLHSLY